MAEALRVICGSASEYHRQGDNVLLLFRVAHCDRSIIEDLSKYDIDIYLCSQRAIFQKYSYLNGEWKDSDTIEMDSNGYVAVHLPSALTAKMNGPYYVRVSLSDSISTLHSSSVFVTEIIPLEIDKI